MAASWLLAGINGLSYPPDRGVVSIRFVGEQRAAALQRKVSRRPMNRKTAIVLAVALGVLGIVGYLLLATPSLDGRYRMVGTRVTFRTSVPRDPGPDAHPDVRARYETLRARYESQINEWEEQGYKEIESTETQTVWAGYVDGDAWAERFESRETTLNREMAISDGQIHFGNLTYTYRETADGVLEVVADHKRVPEEWRYRWEGRILVLNDTYYESAD
jgi:hypothetical protein